MKRFLTAILILVIAGPALFCQTGYKTPGFSFPSWGSSPEQVIKFEHKKAPQTMVSIFRRPGQEISFSSSNHYIYLLALESGSANSSTRFYTDINGNGKYRSKRNPDIRYYTKPVFGSKTDGYSGPVVKLSQLESRNWLNKISFDLGSGDKAAVSYYKDGRWEII